MGDFLWWWWHFLDQDQKAALGGDLMGKQVDVDLGMVIMDLGVAILEGAQVREEKEEDVVVEDLDRATRMGGLLEVVMTTVVEEILESITSNLPTLLQ